MITQRELAEHIEQGLNAILHSAELPINQANPFFDKNIVFEIWATAGQRSRAQRNGNKVTTFITGNLRSSSSSNEANILVMGYNGLILDFSVPVHAPKTISTQTAEQLKRISADHQYPFVQYIKEILDGYFAVSQVYEETDKTGTSYTVTIDAGVSTDGIVDLVPVLGENVIITVALDVRFLEGGVNSRNVELYIDEGAADSGLVPILAQTLGRSARSEQDVWSNDKGNRVKSIDTATAFSIDFSFPANNDNATRQVVSHILNGDPNVVHFVRVKYADFGMNYAELQDKYYLMKFDNTQNDTQGTTYARLTASLVESVENPELLDIPSYMKVGYFSFGNSTVTELKFFTDKPALVYIAGKVIRAKPEEPAEEPEETPTEEPVKLTPNDLIYNYDTGLYDVYIISLDKSVGIISDTPFTWIEEAQNE